MANLQIRIEDTLKDQAQTVAQSMGIDLPAAVRLFLTQMVRENGLPFRPVAAPSVVAKRIGIAKGKFRAPDDLDRDNEEIAALFGGGL